MYNLTNISDAVNPYEMTVAINQQSNGLVGLFIVLVLFIIIFIVYKRFEEDTKEVLLVDTVITAIVSVLMWSISLISWQIVIIPILGLFASVIIYKFS